MSTNDFVELAGYLLVCWVTGFGSGSLYLLWARFTEQAT